MKLLPRCKPMAFNNSMMRALLGAAPIAFVAACIWLKVYDKALYQRLISEDGPFEWLQCLLYLSAGCVAAYRFRGSLKNRERLIAGGYALLAVGLIFVAGEEISWGHSMLQLELPDYFERHNTQGDLTVHNLDAFQPFLHNAYIAVGFGGAFAWLAAGLLCGSRFKAMRRALLPPPFTSLYFLPVGVFYLYIEHLRPRLLAAGYSALDASFDYGKTFLLFKDQEAAELLLASGFLLFLVCARSARLEPAGADSLSNRELDSLNNRKLTSLAPAASSGKPCAGLPSKNKQ